MNPPRRSLGCLKRIAGVALLLFLVAPAASAIELKVVGDNTPVGPANFGFRHYCGPVSPSLPNDFDNDLFDCNLAQAFSLSSGAYVNRITLTLVAAASKGGPYPLSLVVTKDLNSGPVVLQEADCLAVPSSAADAFFPVSVSFPSVFLPKGSYYLVFQRSHPVAPTILAEKRESDFQNAKTAIKAFISSEWPKGIDGIAIKRFGLFR